MEHKICMVIIGSCITVDEDEAVATVVVDEASGGIDRQAGAGNDQKIGSADGLDAAFDGALIQTLFVEYNVGLDNAAAVTLRYANCITHKFRAVEFSAAGAVIAKNTAMEFIDPLTACFLVQAVDILGHYSRQFPFLLPAGEDFVGDVGCKAVWVLLLPIKAEKILRTALIKAVADNGLRRIFKLLII